MDWYCVEGNWKQVAGKVKEKWGKLTDDDLTAINGRRDQLKERLRSVMASPRIRSKRTLTTGMASSPGSYALKSVSARRFAGLFFYREDGYLKSGSKRGTTWKKATLPQLDLLTASRILRTRELANEGALWRIVGHRWPQAPTAESWELPPASRKAELMASTHSNAFYDDETLCALELALRGIWQVLKAHEPYPNTRSPRVEDGCNIFWSWDIGDLISARPARC